MKNKKVIVAILAISLLSVAASVLANPPAPQDPLIAAKTWAEGVKMRNGAQQYAVMDPDLRAEYYDEFVAANWSTGVSSPWIESYVITKKYKGANGAYRYQVRFNFTDSTEAAYYTEENVTVRKFEGRWLVCAIERVEVRGKITQVTYGNDKKVSDIFVVADAAGRGSYDQANVIIGSDTKIYKGFTDQELKVSDLREGTVVAVTFTDDPRIMIYPPSAKARIIRVMDINAQALGQEQSHGQEQAQQQAQRIIYKNSEYGFSFTLPAGWEGYQIVTEKWEGYSLEEQQSGGDVESGEVAGSGVLSESGRITESGPLINIRHPQWTAENPRQDIPIMIFTMAQWDALQQDKFHIGAAPMGPKELGRNSKYVFVLPARYNYAFPEGFEEVEAILESNALTVY